MTESAPVPYPSTKHILQSPPLSEVVDAAGGFRQAKVLNELGLELDFEGRTFASKDEYRQLPIVQRSVVLLNEPLQQVAVSQRMPEESKGQRFIKGASILISSDPGSTAQQVLDKKVDHRDVVVPDEPLELISVNNFRGGYVFLVTVVRTDVDRVLGGKGTDKQLRFFPVADALEALGGDGKEMECNILRLVLSELDIA